MKVKAILIFSLFLCFWCNTNAQDLEKMAIRLQAMGKEKDPSKNVIAMQNIIKDFKLDKVKNAEEIDMLKGNVALSCLKAGDYPKFENYVNLIKNKFNQTSFMNMAVDMLLNSKAAQDYTEKLAKNTVRVYESYKDDPSAKPSSFPLEDWSRFMRMAACPYYESYAKSLFENGKVDSAFLYEEKALQDQKIEELFPSSIELYTTLLTAVGQVDKAYDILLQKVSIGKASLQMEMQFKKLLIGKLGTEIKAVKYLDSIQVNIKKVYQIEITKKMLTNVNAPDFSMLDLKGKRVSLADFKGKIVVLDFWATWCAPCIASMPAMKKISEQHPEVVFLFVATQETGIDAITRIKDYVMQHQFPLYVLLDTPLKDNPKVFPTSSAYQLKSIPAKMVIDINGKLRFKSAGFTTDKELIDELSAMINIAKTQ